MVVSISRMDAASRMLSSIHLHEDVSTKSARANLAGNLQLPDAWLEDIDTTTTPKCGQIKCLFVSRTNPSNYGYTVSQHPNKPVQEMLQKATSKAQELSNTFGVRNTLLGEPFTMPCTERLQRILNQNLPSHCVMGKPRKPYHVGVNLTLQPIEIAPKDSILFGMSERKNLTAWKELEQLKVSLSEASLQETEARLRFDLNATLSMIHSTEGRCLIKDFQVLVHPPTGRIYQFDFDRCWEEGIHSGELNPWWVTHALQDFVEALLKKLRNHWMKKDDVIECNV